MTENGDFSIDPSLEIGTVFEVTGTTIKVALQRGLDELSRLHRGRVHTVGEVGSLVRLRFGRRVLFASVKGLRLQTEEEAAALSSPTEAEKRVLEADLIGEGYWNAEEGQLKFERGLTGSALPMQKVHLLTDSEMRHLYKSLELSRGNKATFVPIGDYVGATRIPATADIDRMFGHHCAILGSTGSGKSSAVAAIIRSVLEAKPDAEGRKVQPRIVLIDPHGEYGRAFKNEAVVYRAYSAAAQQEEPTEELRLPFWLMSSDEFRSLVVGKGEFEATSQANIVYKALAHSRMVQAGLIEKSKNWIGIATAAQPTHPEDHRLIAPEGADTVGGFDRDRPLPFTLAEFRAHISQEQCLRIVKEAWQKVTDSEWHSDYSSLLNKLRVLESDSRIKFLMGDYSEDSPTLAEIIGQFVGERADGKTIRIVDISGLPNEVAGPLTGAIARLIFQYKLNQTAEERQSDPIVFVCEEAHRYVPDRGEAQYAVAQSAIRRIAREGRKYGVGLMLVSQRPSDVEGTVISQCGTWIVLRLSNGADQAHVARFLPDSLAGLVSLLPSLPRREALFVGEGAALPARIRLRYLAEDQRPKSDDIAFGEGWRNPLAAKATLLEIADRMSGKTQE